MADASNKLPSNLSGRVLSISVSSFILKASLSSTLDWSDFCPRVDNKLSETQFNN